VVQWLYPMNMACADIKSSAATHRSFCSSHFSPLLDLMYECLVSSNKLEATHVNPLKLQGSVVSFEEDICGRTCPAPASPPLS